MNKRDFKLFVEKAALWSNTRAEYEACIRTFCSLARVPGLAPTFNEEIFVEDARAEWAKMHGEEEAEKLRVAGIQALR